MNDRYMKRAAGFSSVLLIGALALSAQAQDETVDAWSHVPAELRDAVERITPASLSGDLSFIASDLLGGRGTPSPGLEMAAHYIAAQFRGAGLEPVGDDGYFQTARWEVLGRGEDAFTASITLGARTVDLQYEQVSILTEEELNLTGARLVRLAIGDASMIDSIDPAMLKGAVVLTDLANFRTAPRAAQREVFTAMQSMLPKLQSAEVAAVIGVDRSAPTGSGFGAGELVDPEAGAARRRGFRVDPPLLWSHDPEVAAIFDALESGPADGAVNLRLGPAAAEPVKLYNVVGLLRGSDAALADEYVLVTAHYDHLGSSSPVDGDAIFNGANDDGSGTVSVIALARALGSLAPEFRPARSVLFMTVFGEERGLLGSRYYSNHPIVPLDRTIGNINLEQVGRTDSTEGPQIRRASLTGFAFSTLTDSFVEAGLATGVDVYDHPANSESFFGRSDNVAFAALGIPAHTLCVAYEYPDYHGRGDHWDKVDYENMAAVGRMVTLGLYLLADRPEAPVWNTGHPRTGRYVEAWRRLHGVADP